jgi:hypothetical protein
VSVPFVSQLRAARAPIKLAEAAEADTITIRVEVAELWDAVRVIARPETPVAELKQRVVAEFFPSHQYPEDFVLKFRGWEILDENGSLKDCGIVNGSILLLGYRRRRPVR